MVCTFSTCVVLSFSVTPEEELRADTQFREEINSSPAEAVEEGKPDGGQVGTVKQLFSCVTAAESTLDWLREGREVVPGKNVVSRQRSSWCRLMLTLCNHQAWIKQQQQLIKGRRCSLWVLFSATHSAGRGRWGGWGVWVSKAKRKTLPWEEGGERRATHAWMHRLTIKPPSPDKTVSWLKEGASAGERGSHRWRNWLTACSSFTPLLSLPFFDFFPASDDSEEGENTGQSRQF